MIFQILQNKLHLTSAHMHIFFIILMGLYLALQIIDRSKGTLTLIDEHGKKHIMNRDAGIWQDEQGNVDSDHNDASKTHKSAKPNFVVSFVVSVVFGLASWMLTTAVIQFMPEAIVGSVTRGSLGTIANLGYEFFMVGSFILVIPAFGLGIYLAYCFTGKSVPVKDGRFSFAVLAGGILPFYSFIHAVTPLNTGIFFGVSALSETVILFIGLIMELVFGGGFGLIRALLEYTVSFALFSSLLTFPLITRNIFTVLGAIVGAIVTCYVICEYFPIIFDFSFSSSSTDRTDFTLGRTTYWDLSYRVLSNTLDKLEVEDDKYGTKYIYNKGLKRWEDSSGMPVRDTLTKGLDDISNFY